MSRGPKHPLFELIQAHADDSTSADVVARTRIVPISRNALLLFAGAAALPICVAALLQSPARKVATQLVRLLFH